MQNTKGENYSVLEYIKETSKDFGNKENLRVDEDEFLEARLARYHGYALVQCSEETHTGVCTNQVTPTVAFYSSNTLLIKTPDDLIEEITSLGWDAGDIHWDTSYGSDNLYAKCPIHKGL